MSECKHGMDFELDREPCIDCIKEPLESTIATQAKLIGVLRETIEYIMQCAEGLQTASTQEINSWVKKARASLLEKG